MKLHKLLVVSILILAILTIGAVSAAEDAGGLTADDTGDAISTPIDENAIIAQDGDGDVPDDEDWNDWDDDASEYGVDFNVPRAILTGEDAYVSAEASEGTSGIIKVSYKDADDEDGDYQLLETKNIKGQQTKVSLSGLNEGHYRIFAEYYTDDDGTDGFGTSYDLFVLNDLSVDLNITYFNENVIAYKYVDSRVRFDISEHADGNVTLYIDGEPRETIRTDGLNVFSYSVATYAVGEHDLSVNFTSETQPAASDAVKFNVVAADIFVPDEMNLNDLRVSANTIEVEVGSRAVGTITILIDNKTYKIENVNVPESDKHYYLYSLADVSRGKHDVVVKYEDDNYGSAAVNKTVNFDYVFPVEVQEIYGKDNTITVYLPDDLGNGDLTISLDGNKVEGIKDSNKITINPSRLSLGNHTLLIKYTGDDVYPAKEVNQIIPVHAGIDIYSEDFFIGSDYGVSLILSDGAKGKLNVTVSRYDDMDDEGELYDAELVSFSNGKAYYSFSNLPLGYYYVEASYTGDDYLIESADSSFEVTNIDWGEESLHFGDDKTVRFVSHDAEPGQLHIVFSGYLNPDKDWDDSENVIESVNITLVNGRAEYTIRNLQYGAYHIFAADESLDGELKGFQGGFSFSVYEDMDTPTGEYAAGEIGLVVINFPSNVTGKVVLHTYYDYINEVQAFHYNDFEYAVNGPLTIDLNEVFKEKGNFAYDINYTGMGHFYHGFYPITITDVAAKQNPNITVTAVEKINVGDDAVISIVFPEDSQAEIVVSADGKDYTAKASGGKSSVTISDLKEGNYTATVLFKGDSKYASQIEEVSIAVSKKQAEMTVACDEKITKGNALIVNVNVAGAEGKVTISAADKKFTADLADGKAAVNVTDLNAGTYDVVISYEGSDMYAPASQTRTVNVVDELDPVITAKDTSVLYTANGKFTVTVKGSDANTAKGVEVIFKIKNKQVGKATTNDNGVAVYTVKDVPGSYQITATALGVSLTKKLTVKHLVTLKSAAVKKSAKKLTLQATLAKVNGKYLKNKKITFKFNGKTYIAKTNSKGVVKLTIKNAKSGKNTYNFAKLKVGKKITYQATYLKDTVKKTTKVKK